MTWKLKRNVQWHDGKPSPRTTSSSRGSTPPIPPRPRSPRATTRTSPGSRSSTPHDQDRLQGAEPRLVPDVREARLCVIPKHVFEPFKGAKSREAPANLKPVGTGPYRIVDFKPGDVDPGGAEPQLPQAELAVLRPARAQGRGRRRVGGRAVIQTGEYDFAWNIQVEDDVLRRMEQGGKGRTDIAAAGGIEHLLCNFSDPWTEVDGERGSAKSAHPFLTDPAVRQALSLLIDRAAIQEQLYGRQGQATANYLNAPSRFRSTNTRWEFSVDKANAVLDQAGWKRGADGIRAKDGKRLKMVYQTSINPSARRPRPSSSRRPPRRASRWS